MARQVEISDVIEHENTTDLLCSAHVAAPLSRIFTSMSSITSRRASFHEDSD